MRAPTVVVGMSGGVDSSVSALLLKQQGYRVIGMFMKNWEEQNDDGICTSAIEYEDVIRVCEKIDIPYYSVNFVKEYRDNVFTHFLKEFEAGHTPNPDILCNREIKFKAFLNKALEVGADYLATGHYCRVGKSKSGQQQLLKGVDPGKDQSYFLYTIGEDVLSKVMFPVGGMVKKELREIARKHDLPTADKEDSTGVCFIGERNFKEFLSKYLAAKPGNFEDLLGKVVGRHDGAAYYTPGQRRGMGVGGPGEPWFVVDKDMARNVVILAQGTRHPALYCDELVAGELSWVSKQGAPPLPFTCKSKIRYRQPDQECVITKVEDGKAHVIFNIPQRAVTVRQSIVFYDGDVCLGGGIIEAAGPSYYARGLALPDVVSP